MLTLRIYIRNVFKMTILIFVRV